jgi:hypothetical protein
MCQNGPLVVADHRKMLAFSEKNEKNVHFSPLRPCRQR